LISTFVYNTRRGFVSKKYKPKVGDRVKLAPTQTPIPAYVAGYSAWWAPSNFDESKVGVVVAVDVPHMLGGTRTLVDYCDSEMKPAYAPCYGFASCNVGMRRVMVHPFQIVLIK
jgi:hypothetical protein